MNEKFYFASKQRAETSAFGIVKTVNFTISLVGFQCLLALYENLQSIGTFFLSGQTAGTNLLLAMLEKMNKALETVKIYYCNFEKHFESTFFYRRTSLAFRRKQNINKLTQLGYSLILPPFRIIMKHHISKQRFYLLNYLITIVFVL